MKKTTSPDLLPAAALPTALPAKKAARKAASPKAAPAAPALAAPLEAAPPPKSPRKAAAKKAPAPAAAVLPAPVPAPVPAPMAAPAAAPKKASRKAATPAPAPAPPTPPTPPTPPVAEPVAAPAARAPRKAAAKKAAPPAAEPELFPEITPPAPTPRRAPARKSAPPQAEVPPQAEIQAETRPQPEPQAQAASLPPSETPAQPHAEPPSYRSSSYPPRQERSYPPRDPNAPPSDSETGPDGESRRLTKWERWKQRKEKFKQQKQQRFQDRLGRPLPPGHTPTEAESPERRDPRSDSREPRSDSRDPRSDSREPRSDSREPRSDFPREPRSDSPERREPRDPRSDSRDPRDHRREPRDPRDHRREPREPRDFREPRSDHRPDSRSEPRSWEPRAPRPEIPLSPPEPCSGLLEITDKGFAFLRPQNRGFVPSPSDPFISSDLVRQHGLREGVWVDGMMQRGGRGPQVTQLLKVNGLDPSAYRTLPLFEELTAINPNKRYILETEANRHTTRLIDFISPIGRGQRGLIVAPPRAGKTTFLQHIAEAVLHNYEDVKVIVLLVDERPEEVTEIARALPGAEIMASSNDQDPRNHIRMAHLAVERAKRLVEAGQHVFMLLDSITRLARGFNNAMRGGGGKAMSGGLDSRALEAPRRLFAAARNTREAGSLTIMATALVETNNKGDDLIFQEFKGTGNMELVLDRKISQAYVYPAVDIFKSGTRREELLLPAHQLEKVHLIRRGLSGHRPQEAVERLLQVMGKYTNNNQMLIEIKARGE